MARLWLCAAAFVLALGACSANETAKDTARDIADTAESAGERAADTIGGEKVSIKNLAFNPQTLDAKVGANVTWTNEDTVPHTATSKNKSFDSGQLAGGKAFSFRFTQAGEFPYYCEVHGESSMSGIVKVT